MSEPERPYISFGQADRPAAEEHRDGVELLVRAVLERYTGDLLDQVRQQARLVLPLAAERIMEEAYRPPQLGDDRPGSLRLMGAAEIAEFLGLASRQRVWQMRQAASLNFPAPVAELRVGPVWLAEDIERWAPTWKRQRGRPRKEDR